MADNKSVLEAEINNSLKTKTESTPGNTLANTPTNAPERKISLEKALALKSIAQLPPNAALMLVVDCIDGRGDFVHFKRFAVKIKTLFPKLKLIALIGTWAANQGCCRDIIQFLESNIDFFSFVSVELDFTTQYKGKSFSELDRAYQTLVRDKLKKPYENNHAQLKDWKGIGILNISSQMDQFFNPRIRGTLLNYFYKVPQNDYLEYAGSNSRLRESSHPMGMEKGIRLVEEWAGEITPTKRVEMVLSIKNKAFLKKLFCSDTPNSTHVEKHMESRMFFPGYIQNELGLAVYILAQLIAFKDKTQGFDFYVPKEYLHTKALAELLGQLGYKPEDWSIVQPESKEATEKPTRIRIFTDEFYLDDNDFIKPFYFSGESTAGASGDDTYTTLASSLNLPFFINFKHPIKAQFMRSVREKLIELECEHLAEFIRLFNCRIQVPTKAGEHATTELSTQICMTGGRFDQTQDYLEDVPYASFLLNVARVSAELIGQYVKSNATQLFAEQQKYRDYLFRERNIFSTLPGVILNFANTFVKKSVLSSQMSNADASLPSKVLRYLPYGKDVDIKCKKATLNDLFPTEGGWKYNVPKEQFFTTVKSEEMEELKEKLGHYHMHSAIDFMIDPATKTQYCIIYYKNMSTLVHLLEGSDSEPEDTYEPASP